jgi:hypothetical protein
MTIKDKPRSYTELFVDTAKQYSSQLYLLGFLFFSLFTVVGVATLIHIQFIEIPVISSAEAAEGVSFKEQVYLPGLYLNIALYIAAGTVCLHSLVTS